MKTRTGTALLLLLVFAIPGARLLAQAITVTTADLQAVTAQGKTITRQIDSVTTSINIGTPGATSWNFESLKTSATLNLLSVAVTGTSWANEFTSANVALQLQNQISIVYGVLPIPLQDVCFYSSIDAAYQDMGLRGSSPLASDGIARWISVPADTAYVFPMTFGSTWTSTFKDSLYLHGTTFLGLVNFAVVKNHVDTSMVDGYGIMTLPGGTTHDALRIRTIDHITTLNASDQPTGTTTAFIYTFVARDGARVRLIAADPTQPDSGLISVSTPNDFIHDIQWDAANIASDVPLAAGMPSEFTLQQNYPNPFNPSTTIRYSVPQRATVALTVYNLLGQQVAQLVLGERERGTYEVKFDAGELPSGAYFYRLSAGSYVETRRMMLMK